jgi:hypothetical protein
MPDNPSVPLATSEEICEALVRHLETNGLECFEKNFIKGGKIVCTVWCVIGPNAWQVAEAFASTLDKLGFRED